MNICILGSGGREHALVDALSRCGHKLFCHPGNPGMLASARRLTDSAVSLTDFKSLADAVRTQRIDLTVVGPELPLSLGIADFFAKEGLALFGPTQAAAQLESSKAFAKEFMLRHKIPTARFEICRGAASACEAARRLFTAGKQPVVKPSGLTGGKGVVCCDAMDEAERAIHACLAHGDEIVVEERLQGPEVSLLALCDGKRIAPLLPAQDHKRLFDGGRGPNTGGIGAIAPVPVAPSMLDEIEAKIVLPTLKGLIQEGLDYRGTIYFGLMLTRDGPQVLEYNCRFGDPETQVVLPLLDADLGQLMLDCVHGRLDRGSVRFHPSSACCVVLTSRGYPEAPEIGFEIRGLEALSEQHLRVFHAGTAIDAQNNFITSGGRVLGVTAIAAGLQGSIDAAYAAVDRLHFEGVHYRKDIGKEMC